MLCYSRVVVLLKLEYLVAKQQLQEGRDLQGCRGRVLVCTHRTATQCSHTSSSGVGGSFRLLIYSYSL
jgi:hypothetical protein